jgi:hypothetical protein
VKRANYKALRCTVFCVLLLLPVCYVCRETGFHLRRDRRGIAAFETKQAARRGVCEYVR